MPFLGDFVKRILGNALVGSVQREDRRRALVSLVLTVLRSLAATLQTRRHLVLENLALRHQLLVLKRTAKTPALRNSDRLFWALLSTTWSRWTKALVILPAADGCALASSWIQALLALEIAAAHGSRTD